jgi:hypothetical protein
MDAHMIVRLNRDGVAVVVQQLVQTHVTILKLECSQSM